MDPAPDTPPPAPDHATWFRQEIVPYEPMLRASLRREFPQLRDVDDVVQESYLRLMRARVSGGLKSARGFLFTAARHIAVDVFRRRRTASTDFVAEIEDHAPADRGPTVDETVCRRQELELLAEAIESLPLRCRQVMKLQKIHGLSYREIAERLGIAERTVNVQLGRGIRRCAQYMEARGLHVAPIYRLKPEDKSDE